MLMQNNFPNIWGMHQLDVLFCWYKSPGVIIKILH